jgi:hypothetical protein
MLGGYAGMNEFEHERLDVVAMLTAMVKKSGSGSGST